MLLFIVFNFNIHTVIYPKTFFYKIIPIYKSIIKSNKKQKSVN